MCIEMGSSYQERFVSYIKPPKHARYRCGGALYIKIKMRILMENVVCRRRYPELSYRS